jgi:hypothetical protein
MAAILAPVADDQPTSWPDDTQYIEDLTAAGFTADEVMAWVEARWRYKPLTLRVTLAGRRN